MRVEEKNITRSDYINHGAKCLLFTIVTFCLSSCAYLAGYSALSNIYSKIEEMNVNTHEQMRKFGNTQMHNLPYINCWASVLFLPLPLVKEENVETIYGIKGVRVTCAFDEMGSEAAKNKTPWLHRYYIVENNGKIGEFANWGMLENAKILEMGTVTTMDMQRNGVVTSYKDTEHFGVFVFANGKIKRSSPFILGIDGKAFDGRFGKKELVVTSTDNSIVQWTPSTDEELEKISSLIPNKYRERGSR